MSLETLIDLIHSGDLADWTDRNDKALDTLFGSDGGRYPKSARDRVLLRAPSMNEEREVTFAAYIHPINGRSGPYGGMSFVLFPRANHPCLFGLVAGTNGLSPDEAILGRPGHARKARAICEWLNRKYGLCAWAKYEPTRTDVAIPRNFRDSWQEHASAIDRYGGEMYAMFRPSADRAATKDALSALLDVYFEERGFVPIAKAAAEAATVRQSWFDFLMPSVEVDQAASLLKRRRFVILQGPPGTGKTKMALDLLAGEHGGFGKSIQFHANTTYENFVGGLAPVASGGEIGLQFRPSAGFLMEAARLAREDPSRNYLLHIDEINRADLGKVLGEAIFLLEVEKGRQRSIDLSYDFGSPFGKRLALPENLHILGTMNSSDRSIAIVDVAVRRRFAFLSLWPRMSVVEAHGCRTMQEAFEKLVSLFVEHASAETFALVPGHSYFLESDEERAKESLRTNLVPLLEEYLAQGYVSGFAEPIRAYMQWLHAL